MRKSLFAQAFRQRNGFRPIVEALEDRCLMAVAFLQTNLVADTAGAAQTVESSLINPWGLAVAPTSGSIWVADNGSSPGVSTLYDGDVKGSAISTDSLVVTIPGGVATGVAFNPTSDFTISQAHGINPAQFIFDSTNGTITAWAADTYLGTTNTQAQVVATTPNAVYKGLALGNNGTANFLYAANFNSGKIDVFDKNFQPATLAGSFTDPNLPAGYAPFNIANLNGKLYVTYAVQDGLKQNQVPGPGDGVVDVFDFNGNFLQRLISNGTSSVLNAPWGITVAPASMGGVGGMLLVGNFGGGEINAFNPTTGNFVETLTNTSGQPIAIPGLWGLIVGNGVSAGDSNAVYFTAGTGHYGDGLFGSLRSITDMPLTAQGANITATPGVPFSGTVGTFTDPDTQATSSEYTATIMWGDGATSTGTVAFGASAGFTITGSHTYAAPGRFAVTISIQKIGGSNDTDNSHAVVGTTNDRFLAKVYEDLLARAIDAGALAFWNSQLGAGVSHGQIVSSIEASQEYLGVVVEQTFQNLLHRNADSGAVTAFTSFLAAGGSQTQLDITLASSAEFFQTQGKGTVTGYVDALYSAAFGRTADSGGLAFFTQLLSGGASHAQAAGLLFGSGEFFEDFVKAAFTRFLHRSADPAGLSNLVGLLEAGMSDAALVSLLMGSTEYANLA